MAITWSSKTPDAVMRFTWAPSLVPGDSIASHTLTVTTGDAVVDDSTILIGEFVEAFISGGTAGTITTFAGEVVTTEGETLTETIYLPIYGPDAIIAATARDVCSFALRKIIGMGETAEADELDDALERLNMMLLAWRRLGADVGCVFPLVAATDLSIPDEYVAAVKFNLRMQCHEHYGEPLSAYDVEQAKRGLQLVKSANLSDDRAPAEYF